MDIHHIFIAATEVASEAAAQKASGGVLGTLGINWKLFLAQLVNFGIVLFVFWRWIVKPLGTTLTQRQERIESGLKNADRMDAEKKKFEEWKIGEMRKVRNEADNILRTTTDTANKIKQETIVEAQHQANKLLDQAKANIDSEKNQMLKEVKQEIATLVVTASEKILRHKLDPKKDHELINESLKGVK
ncbi:MAG: F0F1 ATP synthase subunit B [Candidatus Doudnabacteria bacterium]|nr:F0F1 ATP synthase subunit B [Candidatus Doudnabacteria bacterium]